MMKKNVLIAAILLGSVSTSAFADAVFLITEAYTGVSGNDGTPDWFELTNFGDMAGSIGGLYYDDDSADPTKNYALPSFTVAPGESVIVLIEANSGDIAPFYDFWALTPSDVQVGITGGGSLSQGGDQVNVFDGNTAGANLVDSLTYDGSMAGLTGTVEDITGNGPLVNSVLGVNGAFMSVGTTGIGQIVGSPGVVPEPASLALLAVAGLALRRRSAASRN